MGTTRIKVIDLSSDEKEIKTSRKHAEKLTDAAKLKATGPEGTTARREEKKPKKEVSKVSEVTKAATTENTEVTETTEPSQPSKPSQSFVPPQPSEPSQPSKSSKPSSHHKGHKYLAAKQKIENGKQYPAKEAIALLSETSTVKFDPTVELHLNVVDKSIKGSVNFPHPFAVKSKEKKYLIFA